MKEIFNLDITKRSIAFLLLIIQSCGIRFSAGLGSLLIVLIVLLSISGLKHISKKETNILVLVLVFLMFNIFINQNFEWGRLIFKYGTIVEAILFLLSYKNLSKYQILADFYNALKIIFVHALVGIILYTTIPSLFNPTNAFGYPYKTFLNIFFVTNNINEPIRNNGLMWEPGLLQLMLNLLLFLSIKYRRSTPLLIAIVFTILTTGSTTGYITLGVNAIYFMVNYWNFKRNLVAAFIILSIIFSGSLYIIKDNFNNKFNTDNTSALIRYRDYQIGIELITQSPLFGHGSFDGEYLRKNKYVKTLESNLFSQEYLSISQTMSGGYTNGFLGFFGAYGIPIGLLVYTCFFINRITNFRRQYENLFFFLIFCFCLMSEPISNTPFFFIFPLSTLLYSNEFNNYYYNGRLQWRRHIESAN